MSETSQREDLKRETMIDRCRELCDLHQSNTRTITRYIRPRPSEARDGKHRRIGVICAFESKPYVIPKRLYKGAAPFLETKPGTLMIGFSRCGRSDEWNRDIGLWNAIKHAVPATEIPHIIQNARQINGGVDNVPWFGIRLNRNKEPIRTSDQFPKGTPIIPASLIDQVYVMVCQAATAFSITGIKVGTYDRESGDPIKPAGNVIKPFNEWMRTFLEEIATPPKDPNRKSMRDWNRLRRSRTRHLVVSWKEAGWGWIPFTVRLAPNSTSINIAEKKTQAK